MPKLKNMTIRGISKITLNDIKFVNSLGYKIKLLAISCASNKFQCSVEPWLISNKHILSNINGVLNAVEIKSNLTGPILLTGAGAGAGPTASAVLSDLYDYLSRSNRTGFTNSSIKLKYNINTTPYKDNLMFYIRATVLDKSGVLADLTKIFKLYKISIQSFFQDIMPNKNTANLYIITHNVGRLTMYKAIKKIENLKGVVKEILYLGLYD